MTLYEKIKEKLKTVSRDDLLKEIGYHSIKTGSKTLDKFLESGSIYGWLKESRYDMVYSGKTFLRKLVEALDMSKNELEVTIAKAEERMAMMKKLSSPYLYAKSKNKEKPRNLAASLVASFGRSLYFDEEEFADLSKEEAFTRVREAINNKYVEPHKDISEYVYTHSDGEKYFFDLNGNYLRSGAEDHDTILQQAKYLITEHNDNSVAFLQKEMGINFEDAVKIKEDILKETMEWFDDFKRQID